MERLDKIVAAQCGLTRSQARERIWKGAVAVNGEKTTAIDRKVDPEKDELTMFGEPLTVREHLYIMMNKPAGCVSASRDRDEKTVLELLPEEYRRRDMAPAGRLDKDTTGFLLITNDGQLGHRLLSPKHHVPKTYLAEIAQPLTDQDIALLERGVDIGDETPTLPASVEIPDGETPTNVLLTITEGRYHQVKRMFEAVGKPVISLHRQSFGALTLDPSLAPGEYRELTEEELESWGRF